MTVKASFLVFAISSKVSNQEVNGVTLYQIIYTLVKIESLPMDLFFNSLPNNILVV